MALQKWLLTEPRIIDLELVRSLTVGLIAGKVDIIGHDEPGARIEVHSVSGKELRIEIDGDRLEIDHPQLRWDNFIEVFRTFRGSARADISVMVPRNVALKFGVVSANALVSGLVTDARISTVSGDIVIDDVTGDLELNSVSGELSARNHTGRVTAHTVSGDIMAQGELSSFTSDGVSGNVFLDVLGIPDRIRTNTVSGDLTVRLDEGVPAHYKVNTVSGKLQLDNHSVSGVRGSTYTLSTGELAGQWVDVAANSVSGDVSVVRRFVDPAAAPAAAADGTASDGASA
ncbi:DUF4097 family beta strand repeat-containing protein [Compostimonas suwonensis]|uniref:Putative adhesin n=1 Tax=Compostimonas suwonensis TaxID=1048394 RepID=A0A2M9C4Q7_9MICO|nr:DUF4097 family beta strand repeat-containing protein [Compostimonas suwonensis]PJJ65514.1 putative adhesin [Compostimonas suwonensis]